MKRQKIALVLLMSMLLAGCKAGGKQAQEDLFEKGINQVSKADYKSAVKTFDKALKDATSVSNRELDISTYKAAAQYLSGDTQGAVKTASNLITYDSKNPDYYYLRGSFYVDSSAYDKAYSDFAKALKLNKNDYKMCFAIYENLKAHGVTEKSEGYLDKVIALDSTKGEILNAKGEAFLYKGDTKNALESYEKAIRAGYNYGYLGKAKCYALDNDKDNASKEILRFESKEKDSPEKYNKAAESLMQLGNYKDALDSVKKGLALSKDSNASDLEKNQIICLEYLGQFDKAKSKAKVYVKNHPGDTAMLREWKILKTR
jgi:tetratricopeptide (TPR) repeat protein